jgi:predicted transcriptional regulator
MDRKKRETLVIALYEKDKTYREIAKELRMSPNTIKAILSRAGLDESTSISSRAFELFSEGKNPLEVSIKLNLEAGKAIDLHQQYFMLIGCNEFTKIYLHIKDNPWPFVNLFKLANEKQMGAEHIKKLLDIANNNLPLVESKYEDLKKEMDSLDFMKNNANRDYRRICDEVSNLRKEIDQLQLIIGQLRHEEYKLNLQKQMMENFVKNFQNSNETCMKIHQMVKQKIENVVSDPRRLLTFALLSIFESSRMHPGKFQSIYYNMSTETLRLSLHTSIGQNEQDLGKCGYNDDAPEKILLDEAEQIYSKLINNFINWCINEITNDTKSSSQILQITDTQEGLSTDKVSHTNLNTPEGEVSISTIINNHALQICRHSCDITNERSRGTDVMLSDDETDT